ncbi:unnamed protein product [Linum tenue]|uniref:Uncharacterized protein n=1 Tax=Linum tenue TaxID=586396 RepID=A0AAV0NCF9_9ROSI|nr:unnamed protein product [Linum tenue]
MVMCLEACPHRPPPQHFLPRVSGFPELRVQGSVPPLQSQRPEAELHRLPQ